MAITRNRDGMFVSSITGKTYHTLPAAENDEMLYARANRGSDTTTGQPTTTPTTTTPTTTTAPASSGSFTGNYNEFDTYYQSKMGRGMPGGIFDKIKNGDTNLRDFIYKGLEAGAIKQDSNGLSIDYQWLRDSGNLEYAKNLTGEAKDEIANYDDIGWMSSLDSAVSSGYITADQKAKLQTIKDVSGVDAANLQLSTWMSSAMNAVPEPTVEEVAPEVIDIENRIKKRLENPDVVNPEDVKKWKAWLDETNLPSEQVADRRILEQFNALGALGGSRNRAAMAQAVIGREQAKSGTALGMALDEQSRTDRIIEDSLSRLMNISSAKTQLRLLPWQAKMQERAGNIATQQNLSLAQVQRAWTKQDEDERFNRMMQFYESTKPPQESFGEKLLGLGTSILGYSTFGPLGGIATGAVSSGLDKVFGTDATKKGSEQLQTYSGLPGYSKK